MIGGMALVILPTGDDNNRQWSFFQNDVEHR